MNLFNKLIKRLFLLIIIFYSIRAVSYSLINLGDNLDKSVNYLLTKDNYTELWGNNIDYYTESSYLNKILIQNKNHELSWLHNPFYINSSGNFGLLSLQQTYYDFNGDNIVLRNPYWFGMSDWLNLLMVVTDYMTLINIFISISLILIILLLIIIQLKYKDFRITVTFFVAFFIIDVYSSLIIFHTGMVWFIAILSSIILLLSNNKTHSQYFIFFLTVGSLTAYFDWFSTPALTLIFPALFMIYNHKVESKKVSKLNLKNSIISWLFGYSSTLILHWITVSLFTDSNVLKEGFMRLINNLGVGNYSNLTLLNNFANLIKTIVHNFYYLVPFRFLEPEIIRNNYTLFIVLSIFMFGLVFLFFYLILIINKNLLRNQIELIIVSLSPILWLLLFSQHSRIHAFFTFRILIVTLIACAMITINVYDEKFKINTKIL